MALISYHTEYCGSRFPGARTKRARQKIAIKYRLPVVRVGNATLIDPEAADAHLAKEFARFRDAVPRRGRKPRVQPSAGSPGGRRVVQDARGRITGLAAAPED
jgi:hypothetical protein